MEEKRRAALTGGMLLLHLATTLAVARIPSGSANGRMVLSACASVLSSLLPFFFAKSFGFRKIEKKQKTTLPVLALFLFAVALISAALQLNVFLCDLLKITNTSSLAALPTEGSVLLAVLCYAVIPAVSEELFYRGLLFDALGGGRRAVIMSALCFAVTHFNLYGLFYTVASGVVLGALVLLRGKIGVSIAAHIAVNSVVLGLSVAEGLPYATYSLVSSVAWSLIFGAGAVMAVYCYLCYGQAELTRLTNGDDEPHLAHATLRTLVLPLVYIVALILWQLVRIVL